MCHPSTWVNKKASPSFEVIKSPKGINQETELHQPHADMMFRCFWSRPFVRHLYPMEGRTYGSPPAGRSGWLEWLETKPRQRYRDLKIWMRRTPKWSIFGEKPCDQNLGPFFYFWDTFQICWKKIQVLILQVYLLNGSPSSMSCGWWI